MLSASVPPPSTRFEGGGSLVVQVGALIGVAAVAALLAALPATMRASAALPGDAPAIRVWSALGVSALAPMAVAIVTVRRARVGLGSFAGPPSRLRVFGILLWLALLFVGLTLFGSVLSGTTHHHALAGVTYAFGAVALAVGLGLACARLVGVVRGLSDRSRNVAIALLGGGAFLALSYLLARFLSAATKDPASSDAASTVVDVLAFVFTALFASRDWRVANRPLAILGPPVAVFLASLGLTTLRDPPVYQAIVDRAPAFVPAADFVRWR